MTYLLRTIDPALWAQVKAAAARDCVSVRAAILLLLRAYVAGTVTLGAR